MSAHWFVLQRPADVTHLLTGKLRFAVASNAAHIASHRPAKISVSSRKTQDARFAVALGRLSTKCSAVATKPAPSQTSDLAQLRQIDSCLDQEGDSGESEAVQLAQRLKDDGTFRAFGAARQVPKRLYSLEELRLHKIDPVMFLSPSDDRLARIRRNCQAALLTGVFILTYSLNLQVEQTLFLLLAVVTLFSADQALNGGGLEALSLDTIARAIDKSYADRVAVHESAHFFTAYMLGILPRRYTLSGLDAYQRYKAFNVQAGTQFCDGHLQKEVARGTLSSTSLDKYACIALAGVTAEFIEYGRAEGGLNDVRQLDSLLRALKFSQAKADGQIRWAVLNVTSLLRRHQDARAKLAAAMSAGKTVSQCINVIEEALLAHDDI